jgi:hypothetical protein
MPINPDFRDLFFEFNVADVRYLIIGAHAVMHYSVPRYTKDLDVWVDPTPDNAARVFRALARFGAPLVGVGPSDFTTPGCVVQIGVAPNRIDVLTDVEGLRFSAAWERRASAHYGDTPIALLHIDDLIASKLNAGRAQDLLDVEWLRKAKARKPSRE